MNPADFGPAAAALGCAFLLARRLTPAIRRGAQSLGIVDRPDGRLKRHAEPVPYLGGMAVYLAFLLAVSLVYALDQTLLALLFAGTLLAMLGMFDDLHALSPNMKLLGQTLGCYVLLRAGVHIELTFLPPALAMALSVLWMLAVTNAVNILDVSDGLAAGCCAVAALGVAVLGWNEEGGRLSVLALALAGSLLGFLPFNVAPAKIYLGDTGSMFTGFVLAALTLQTSYTDEHAWAALCPPMLLSVPLLDLAVVSVVRASRGHSPLRGSPDHIALLLRCRGLGPAPIARLAWIVQAACAALAVGVAWAPAPASIACLLVWAVLGTGAAASFIVLGRRRVLESSLEAAANALPST